MQASLQSSLPAECRNSSKSMRHSTSTSSWMWRKTSLTVEIRNCILGSFLPYTLNFSPQTVLLYKAVAPQIALSKTNIPGKNTHLAILTPCSKLSNTDPLSNATFHKGLTEKESCLNMYKQQ